MDQTSKKIDTIKTQTTKRCKTSIKKQEKSGSTYGEFIVAAGYFMIFLLATSYLNTSVGNSMALFKNIIAMIGFGGFSINHFLVGLEQINMITKDGLNHEGPIYRIFRIIIHAAIALYGILVYTYDSHKYEMTMFKDRLYNKPDILGISVNIILVLYSHLYLLLVAIFGGDENIGFFGLIFVYAMDCYNGNNNSTFTFSARIANFLVSIGYSLIVF